MSSALRDLVVPEDGVELATLGRHRLRGIPDEHELFQARAPGLRRAFPALRTATPPAGTRLPHGGPSSG